MRPAHQLRRQQGSVTYLTHPPSLTPNVTYTHTQILKDTLEFANKKVVLVSVPGAFTPTCQEQHVTSYLANLDKLKAKGVDAIVFIAFNDAFVMSAWGKANGINDDSIVCFPFLISDPLC